MISENVEEYLEIIYRLHSKGKPVSTTSIARELKVAPSSVTQMLKKLAKQGYVEYTPYQGVTLTPKGREIGERVLRKHRLLEKFLNTLGLFIPRIHKYACELEHHLPDSIEHAINQKLKDVEAMASDASNTIPLSKVSSGKTCTISFIEAGRASKRLLDLGLTPGTEIKVIKSAALQGPIMVSVRGTTIAIGRGIASKVFVKLKT